MIQAGRSADQVKQVDFYLGSNAPMGFNSYFEQLENPGNYKRTYLIKGGAGCGKSSLMKKAADSLASKESLIERIHCSSDVDSLDGVIFNELGVAVVDATRPHYIEPRYHGAFERTVDICAALDNKALYNNRDNIINISNEISKKHALCCDFLTVIAQLSKSNIGLYSQFVNYEKLNTYINRVLAYEIKSGKNKQIGKEKVRQLSAVTNKGVVAFYNTISTLAKRVYVINDNVGCVSGYMLKKVRERAINAGYDVYSCYCPLAPLERLEHVIIPDLDLAFVTSDKHLDFSGTAFTKTVAVIKKVNSKRFELKKAKGSSQYIISFNNKQMGILLEMAATLLQKAKELHDTLESYFIPNVNFEYVNKLTSEVIMEMEEINY